MLGTKYASDLSDNSKLYLLGHPTRETSMWFQWILFLLNIRIHFCYCKWPLHGKTMQPFNGILQALIDTIHKSLTYFWSQDTTKPFFKFILMCALTSFASSIFNCFSVSSFWIIVNNCEMSRKASLTLYLHPSTWMNLARPLEGSTVT